MSLWLNIVEHGAVAAVGAGLCYGLLWWKGRDLKRLRTLEAESLLAAGQRFDPNHLAFIHNAAHIQQKWAQSQADAL